MSRNSGRDRTLKGSVVAVGDDAKSPDDEADLDYVLVLVGSARRGTHHAVLAGDILDEND